MLSFNLSVAFVCALIARNVVSHPGHDPVHEIAERAAYIKQASRRSLSHCTDSLRARGISHRSHNRRRELANKLRHKRGIASAPYLRARDLDSALNSTHHSNLTGLAVDASDDILFSGNSSCILNPEVTEGPYYVTGEYVREDVSEDQAGVPLTIEFQVIDIATCQPVPNFYLDYWHCNSTGVYSGVVANGNGNSNDTSNLNNTFLRGLQPSDSDGVVSFTSTFPGHYDGRATHIHILGHTNVAIAANGTLASQGKVSHVGQVFFDQDLLSQVATVEPYASNTQSVTLNEDDSILAQAAEDVDPMMEYVLLGDSLSDGIVAWTSIGVNVSASYNVSVAATIYESGGVENENAMGSGGQGGNGTMPSGAPPKS